MKIRKLRTKKFYNIGRSCAPVAQWYNTQLTILIPRVQIPQLLPGEERGNTKETRYVLITFTKRHPYQKNGRKKFVRKFVNTSYESKTN
jgi:hypothetical protein